MEPAENEGVVQLSRAEAKQAWLTAGGDTERAARQALRDRLSKVTHEGSLEMHHHISSVLCLDMASFSSSPHPQVKELSALGFSDEAPCHEALMQSGGEVRGALALLQRPLLEPFHKHIWSDKPEPPVDIHHPDKQVSTGKTSGLKMCLDRTHKKRFMKNIKHIHYTLKLFSFEI